MVNWGGNLPPGAANDPSAPWNEPEPPECDECGEYIRHEDDHAEDCEWSHMNAADIEEAERSYWAEAKWEAEQDR